MQNLFIDPRTLPHNLQLNQYLWLIGCLVAAICLYLFLQKTFPRPKRWILAVPEELENISTYTKYLEKKIQSCWDEEDLPTWLGGIKKFRNDYHYNPNMEYYAKKLDNAYERQKTNIYREQLRADYVIREMQTAK